MITGTINRKKSPYLRRNWKKRWFNRVLNSVDERSDKIASRYFPNEFRNVKQRMKELRKSLLQKETPKPIKKVCLAKRVQTSTSDWLRTSWLRTKRKLGRS